MKKNIIFGFILTIVFIFISILVYFVIKYDNTDRKIKECDNIISNLRRKTSTRFDEKNFPEYAKDFVPDEKQEYFPELKENIIYESKELESFYNKITNNLPKNINDFKIKLVPQILKMMETKKSNDYPSAEESIKNLLRPSNRLINNTARFWAALGVKFEKDGDYKTSLLISQGIFYLIRELDLYYGTCNDFWDKNTALSQSNKFASLAILLWASHPHPECMELSKKVALDILDFAKNDCSLTRYVDFYKYLIDQAFTQFTNKNTSMRKLLNSSCYNKMNELFINKHLYFESKPYFLIKNEYEKYFNYLSNSLLIYNSDLFIELLPNYVYKQDEIIIQYIFNRIFPTSEFYKERINVEEYLGYMEFAAVALLINSYYCTNNKIPASIDELEKWSGIKLPKNRIDNTPYIIDKDGKHTLTFKHIKTNNYGSRHYYYYELKDSQQLYFDFSK